MRQVACKDLGKLISHGAGQQPNVYGCANASVQYGACTLTNPAEHIFNGKTLSSCDTCPLYAAAHKPLVVNVPCNSFKAGPPILIRGLNFAKAMARWAVSGFPTRSQAEIDARLAICQACPHLVENHCNLCGCACQEKNQLMNKLALKTERCPIGKWE